MQSQNRSGSSKQTNQYFFVSDGQKRLFHSDTYFVQYIRHTANFCAWSAFHTQMLWDNGKNCQKIQKNKRIQDFKVFHGIGHNSNFAYYFFQNDNIQKFCVGIQP